MIDVRRIDANDKPLNPDRTHVVYWMTSARRARWNHALDHAIELANEHNVPLIVVECLALGHRWANDRIHTFVLQGMIDNRKLFESSAVTYVPYVETKQTRLEVCCVRSRRMPWPLLSMTSQRTCQGRCGTSQRTRRLFCTMR